MALDVEDGTGKSTAESYCSVADADAYLLLHGNPATWSGGGVTQAQKEESLRLASQYLDAKYGGRWRGNKLNATQALLWGRAGGTDDDGFAFPALPVQLKQATAEVASRHRADPTALLVADVAVEEIGVTSERVKAGPVEEDKSYGGSKASQKSFPLIEGILRPIVRPAGMIERG